MHGNETQKMDPDATDFSMADRERMEFSDPHMSKLYNYFSEVGKNAYHDKFLLSNSVFAKSDLPLPALDGYLEGKEAKRVSFLFCLEKLLRYFFKSFGWLVVSWAQGLAHRFSRQKFTPETTKPLTLIDIFLVPEQIVRSGDLSDRFFPGLEAKLKTKGISYAYVPKFFRSNNPMLYFRMFRQVKEKGRPMLSCFQLLGLFDYLKMFMFVPSYPLRVFRQIRQLGESQEDKLLRFFLWDTMDHIAVKNYTRLLFGQHISKIAVPAIKCISWYENQPQDKNFYKGLRATPGKVKIYGAQLYLWPATLLNLHVDEGEIDFGLVPDRILVNGTHYLQKEGGVDFKIGPAMRYSRLFKTKVSAKDKTALLVLLPFFEYEIDEILKMVKEAGFSVEVFVKFHPATEKEKYMQRLEGKMQMTDDDIYTLFNRVGCVIGQSTGALVEATSLGIPVININTGHGMSHDYLPEFGRGIIWQNASNGTEIVKWVNIFSDLLKTKSDLIHAVAKKHKAMFFCEPTSEKIDEAFELDEFVKTS
jgi:hypothetical protein